MWLDILMWVGITYLGIAVAWWLFAAWELLGLDGPDDAVEYRGVDSPDRDAVEF